MLIEEIVQNNAYWAHSRLNHDAHYFEKLSGPQKPKALYIGCCDSRVVPETCMGFEHGELFVHRNIANTISPTDDNAMSVIHYAIEHLSIAHIIVCGHYDCGGVYAAMHAGEQPLNASALDMWIEPIVRLYKEHKETLLQTQNEEMRHKHMVRMHLEAQCNTLARLPIIEKTRAQRSITVHGMIFNICSGLFEHLINLS